MKRTLTKTCLLAALLFLCATGAAAQKADFGGTWSLDKAKGEGLPPGLEQTMTVTQSADRLDVVTKISGPQGEREVRDRYVLDGKETEFDPPVMNGAAAPKGKRVSKWTTDGAGFDVEEQADLEGPEGPERIKATRAWRLSPDGKTLTIEMTVDGPQGKMKTKRVFDRR